MFSMCVVLKYYWQIENYFMKIIVSKNYDNQSEIVWVSFTRAHVQHFTILLYVLRYFLMLEYVLQ